MYLIMCLAVYDTFESFLIESSKRDNMKYNFELKNHRYDPIIGIIGIITVITCNTAQLN